MTTQVSFRKRRTTTHTHGYMIRRKSRRSSIKPRSCPSNLEIPGLYQVKISPSLQSLLSCRIGINITSDERWMYVNKEKLINELTNRNSSKDSDILKIMVEIEEFSEETILIGSYGNNNFFLCLSEYARNVCENWKEEEKKQMIENLFNLLHRNAFKWNTLGSDKEIDRITYIRSPFNLELELQTHLNIKFDMRLVKDVRDGYVEFVNTRTTFNNLFRKRLDKSSQVSRSKLNKSVQTKASNLFHQSIQYNYTYPEIRKIKQVQENLNKWLTEYYNYISRILIFNSTSNIFTNDYLELPNQKKRYVIENPKLLMSFHDCVACHGKMVNCIAWNALKSGVIAVAYGRVCPKYVRKTPPLYKDNKFIVTDTHLVLIWSVMQPIKPLLYLHAQREITAMNFCPFDPYILIGGCSDGQIVVWDLRDKLFQQKNKNQTKNVEVDLILKEHLSWIKYPFDSQNVLPCIESKFETGHKSHVTVIKWLPSQYIINRLGEFVECEKNEEHMQFLTTALSDSTMLVWDLKPKKLYIPENKKKKIRPVSLDEDKSPLVKLNLNFAPVFQLNFIEPITKGRIYVNDFSFKMSPFSYTALNPETMSDPLQQTNFVRNKENEKFVLEKKFIAATGFGQLYNCSWSEFLYDQGLEINRQKIDSTLCVSCHDGPIYNMQRNPFYADLILTTGGRVFAIWDNTNENIKKPVIWRKALIRYVMAVWSLQNPASLIATREDGKIELWDFDENSKAPLRMTKFIGDQLLSVFVNNSLHHVMKTTCITTDSSGILSIYTTPTKLFVRNKRSKLQNHIRHFYKRKQVMKYWNNYIKKYNGVLFEPQNTDTENQTELLQQNNSGLMPSAITKCQMSLQKKKFSINMWLEKEFNRMYEIMIERSKINLNNMEINKKSQNKLFKCFPARASKIEEYILNKEKIFEEQKSKIITAKIFKRDRFSISVSKEIVTIIKKQFYENYKVAEIEAKYYIETHQYQLDFDWDNMLIRAKKRYGNRISNICSETLRHESNFIPPNIGRRSTRIIMTEIEFSNVIRK